MAHKSDAELDALPDLLADLVRHVEAGLKEGGADKQAARAIAWEAMLRVADAFGGQQWYIPKPDKLNRLRLHDQVWSEFDGGNHQALAAKYKLSYQHIYKIVARMRALDRARRQPALFADDAVLRRKP